MMRNRAVKKCWAIFGLFLLPLGAFPQEEEVAPDYLHPYLVKAAENNAELRALFNEYLAALEEIPQVGALPDPQATFGFFILPMQTRLGAQTFTASLRQEFPWFGTLEAREDVAAEKARMALHMFNLRKKELFRDVQILYNKLYLLDVKVEITEENLELLESFKEIAEIYFESGKAGFTSVLQVEMEEEELSSKLAFLRESEPALVAEFEQLLGEELEQDLLFPKELWQEQLLLEKDQIFSKIVRNNPYLKHLMHKMNIEQYEIEVAEKKGMPSLSLGMSYTNIAPRDDMAVTDNGRDALMLPQVGISIPIFRGKYRALREQQMLEREAAELMKENKENELLTELEERYRDYLNAQREIDLYTRLSTIAEQSLNLLQTELTTGETDFFEIIRMQRQLLAYRLELEKARTEKNNNVYRINYLMGKNYE